MGVVEVLAGAAEPYRSGQTWGPAGPYELVQGVVRFAVDPTAAANARIVDLDIASRAADGTVGFESDFCVLRPAGGAGARRLLFVVSNRGGIGSLPYSATPVPWGTPGIDPGDGFLLERGWTIALCGWQWDVIRGDGVVGFEAPVAMAGDRPVAGSMRVEFRSDTPIADHPLSDSSPLFAFRNYPAADVDDPAAVLTVRDSPEGPRHVVDRGRWRFARDDGSGNAKPDDEHIWMQGGFEAHRYYEVVYTTRICPVVGAGLLAMRDFVSFLRHGPMAEGNPCAGPAGPGIDHTIALGISQSGRALRQFLHEGLNVDEQGRRVFDGVHSHIGGGRRGEFNHRYAQPALTATAGFGFLPPFATDGPGEGLFDRQRLLGGVPRTIFTNSSWEYWRGGGGLTHIDPDGPTDLADPPDVRHYLFAGTDHVGDAVEMKRRMPLANPPNLLGAPLLFRAAFANLEQWVCDDVEPPPSAVPTVADGTAVLRKEALAGLPAIPGARLPDEDVLPSINHIDLGPDAARGVGRWPIVETDPYPMFVSAVDADGNEISGLRVPELAVPLGTSTAWNPRTPVDGLPDVILEFVGSGFPFPRTMAEREASGDPRPSIAERYADRDDYVARARAVAEELVAERYLLPQDLETAVARAGDLYDRHTT